MKNQHLLHIGKGLKSVRIEKNLTQLQLSCLCNIHRPHISMLERNVKRPKLRVIFLLAAGLGMKASELVKEIEHYL
ncbi:helix-turn-helix domain-containing protein [Bacillus salipaludis]|uniref:Helix-turn-helix domain-containing protein n=1 Tax=Bacillus salipaludis TaxID=2547811 RepID=A0ABW8RP73_9BACI